MTISLRQNILIISHSKHCSIPNIPTKFAKQTPTMADDSQDVPDCEKIFKRFDANGDGKISASELGEALKTLGSVTPDEIQRMMAEIDTDGDGFISYEEFANFARANRGLVKDVAKIF
ncbi:unnamed protein product [Fraxinus pennsylvanica]|uniref:EF-hand domain-containing protein n=1 Tax=Fraxinus pennsylvanica TaxID=56036 RepID=A0AAD2E943_9LAMI|nr:unnamed protein product [Fraxinus pennsylvanica]